MKSSDIVNIKNLSFDKEIMDIRWQMTYLCNYDCDFCIQGNHQSHVDLSRGESAEIRSAICHNLCDFINKLYGYRKIKLSLIGGEVTILADSLPIIEELAACSFKGTIVFDITTNFSKPAEYFEKLIKIINRYDRSFARRTLNITASFYSSYISIQSFREKLEAILSFQRDNRKKFLSDLVHKTSSLSLSAGYPIITDEDYTDYLKLCEYFSGTPINVNPIFIRNYPTRLSDAAFDGLLSLLEGKAGITVTDISGNTVGFRNIQALGAALDNSDSFCPYGYYCDAGMHNIWINPFGVIHRCPAIGSNMVLGNILEDNWELLKKPALCTSDHCSCSQFGMITQILI